MSRDDCQMTNVEFKKLGDVLEICNGHDYKNFDAGDVPVYGSGGIMTRIDTAIYDKPSVLIPRKGSLKNLFYVEEPFWTVDTIFYTKINPQIAIPRFVYFCLQKEHLEDLNQAGGVPSLTKSVLNEVRIPIPPIEVQRKIVQILDRFTELISLLKSELIPRKKQFEYYRDQLLSFGSDVEFKKLSEIATIDIGEFVRQDRQGDNKPYPVFNGGRTFTGKYDEFNRDGNYILISARGVNAGFVNCFIGKYWAGNSCYSINVDQKIIDFRFAYHFLKSYERDLLDQQQKGGIPAISKTQVSEIEIPIPPIETQKKIVATLDRFDKLCNDLTYGIPAEIQARQKQYEFYRDKLLTFKEEVE